MTVTFTDDDEGKEVVDASGNTLGLVTEIEDDTAFVDPDPGLTETVKADLGRADADSDEYTVKQDAVETKADEKLHLRDNL
ncbi:PRC-barrel domain containing protein [Haloarcula nitratireducens]|uniref:PRC-barrel domain containing protein n=1 Tax=Haloarcula nitratireducens TaxID=2487749 RepID=A0AAW4PAZ4_9EURY|nr:PRC-barrel domain containing protein [Halomicroarcula nitratireducens]MBX0294911.1 PRC-barrel domain containing protein [Halomicroarcula nitratireducens]